MTHLVAIGIVALAGVRVLAHLGADLSDLLWDLPAEPHVADWTLPASIWVVSSTGATLGVVWVTTAVWWGLLIAVPSVAVLLPWVLARWVAIPTGSHRAAWWLARLAPLTWVVDREGGALFAAAWAALRGGGSAAAIQWVESRRRPDVPMTPTTLAAMGMLAAARGDREEARAFLEATTWFDSSVEPKALAPLVAEFRAADAASRGAWTEVVDIAGGPRVTAATRMLGAIGERLLDLPDAPLKYELDKLWWRSPRLWQAASDWVTREPPGPPSQPPASVGAAPVKAALAAHAWLLASPEPSSDALNAVARAWDAALAGSLSGVLRDRAAELGARRPGHAIGDLEAQVVQDLAALVRRHRLSLPTLTDSTLLASVVAVVREQHLTTIELAAQHLQDRLRMGRALSAVDETREWLALRQVYDEGVRTCGDSLRRLVFRPVYVPLCSLSVSLYNEHDQRWLSNAMTRWLLAEAHLAGDSRAVDLQTRNLEAGG